jgi:cytochrome c-type protein NapB
VRTEGLSSTSNCVQCHVFRKQEELFAASDFRGLAQHFTKADRHYPGAPPVIPHRVFMRENCTSCHSGPVARPEIRCSHPLRANCRQCHVPVLEASTATLVHLPL